MLYILTNSNKQANWQRGYEETYLRMLEKYSIDYIILDDPERTAYIPSMDFVWVMHYRDLALVSNKCRAKILFRMSGTSTHPFCYQVDMQDEHFQLRHVIDINMSFHPRMTQYVKQFYPDITMIDTGYPIYVPDIPKSANRKKQIVIGGRLSPDKQFMLSVYLLVQFLPEYDVIFCYPNNGNKDVDWMNRQGGFERYERLGIKFLHASRESWQRILAESEFFFTASLGDTACVSCVEAVTLGTYPLIPKIGEGLPVYDTYLDVGYKPFCKESLAELVRTKPAYRVDDTWFNPDKWAIRFKEQVLCLK